MSLKNIRGTQNNIKKGKVYEWQDDPEAVLSRETSPEREDYKRLEMYPVMSEEELILLVETHMDTKSRYHPNGMTIEGAIPMVDRGLTTPITIEEVLVMDLV